MPFFESLTDQTSFRLLGNIIDILLVWFVVYKLITVIKGTKAVQLLKGIFVIIIARLVTQALNLETLGWIMQQVLEWGFLAIIIIFQPELRRALEQLGRGRLFSSSTLNEESERNRLIEAMSKSVSYMAKRRIGALVSIERETGLSEYIETGIPMNSDLTSELMINLFIPNTPLHDGAVIVQKNRIAAAACYLPLSESPFISKELGTRHRAALGISEVTDAITIVVSEETGAISLTANGDLHRNLSLEDFEVKLRRIWFGVAQQEVTSSWWNWRRKRMDKMMDNRWFLRITALLLAFLLFFSVQAEDNSTGSTDTSRVSEVIEDVDLEIYHDNDLMVSGVPKTADLYLTGPVSIVQAALQLEDFTLFVDLRNLPLGEHQVPIQTENVSDQLTSRVDPAFVNVVIEERVSQEFRIDPDINDRMLAEGFVLDEVTVEPETVVVTGPKSMIDAISFVKATVSGEQGVNESFTTAARVRVLAEDLTKLENAEIEPEEVEVAVKVVEYSKTVPVRIEATGNVGVGISINNWTTSTKEIRIYGPKTVVDEMTEYVVEVDAASITAEDSTVDVELSIPTGASAVSPAQVTVEAEVVSDDSAQLPVD
ncbi:hypothetical protein B481_3461 [Planococcus halocryophilus Or1]|nr:hypothetical protein B481_3461 [Planococcus halocryophilus Or1]